MISIILPTYKEEKNLEELFRRIDTSLKNRNYEIVLVDDDSPDGTAGKARQLSKSYPVEVFVRRDNFGLSQSVIRGFQQAEGEQIVVMDADLQHPPEKIPELLDSLQESDIAIGSRFTEGEAIEHWGIWRKFVNRTASLIYNIVYWRNRLSDPMSGFFAFKKNKVDTESLDAEGFKILLEILHKNDLKISEVPYKFAERSNGESSFNLSAAVGYMEQIGRFIFDQMGFKQSERIVQALEFMAVGATGVIINYLIFLPAIHYNLHYMVAGFLAFAGALQWNFFWNKTITFDKSEKSFWHQYKYFTLVNLGGLVVYQMLLFLLIGRMGIWEPLANILAIFGGFLVNYFGSEKIAFK